MNTSHYTKKTAIQFHSHLKTQFLNIHKIPFSDFEFRKMRLLLVEAGVSQKELDLYFDLDDSFFLDKLQEFYQLSEKAIISTHRLITKLK